MTLQAILAVRVVDTNGEPQTIDVGTIGDQPLSETTLDQLADYRGLLDDIAGLVREARAEADAEVIRRMRQAGTWTLDGARHRLVSRQVYPRISPAVAHTLRERLKALAFEGHLPADRVDALVPEQQITVLKPRAGDLRKLAEVSPSDEVRAELSALLPQPTRSVTVEELVPADEDEGA